LEKTPNPKIRSTTNDKRPTKPNLMFNLDQRQPVVIIDANIPSVNNSPRKPAWERREARTIARVPKETIGVEQPAAMASPNLGKGKNEKRPRPLPTGPNTRGLPRSSGKRSHPESVQNRSLGFLVIRAHSGDFESAKEQKKTRVRKSRKELRVGKI